MEKFWCVVSKYRWLVITIYDLLISFTGAYWAVLLLSLFH